MGLTGVSSTSGVGHYNKYNNAEFALTGVSATSSVGSIAPADVIGINRSTTTSSVGSISPADVVGINRC